MLKILKNKLNIIVLVFVIVVSCLNISFSSDANTVLRSVASRSYGPGVKLFNGGSITIVKNSTASQMMGYVILTSGGKLIVIDGGLAEDAQHLKEVIKERGGVVDCWFITHPHSDHVGALTKILSEKDKDITINGIYYRLFDLNLYIRNEAYRSNMVKDFMSALDITRPDIKHGSIQAGMKIGIDDNTSVTVMNDPYNIGVNFINNSSVVYRLDMDGKRVMFLGDLGEEGGYNLLKDVPKNELKSDIVQMAHHGQYGVSKEVYEAISPYVAMWNTPQWLWDNDSGNGVGSGPWYTLTVRSWMDDIGVLKHYVIKDGDQIIY